MRLPSRIAAALWLAPALASCADEPDVKGFADEVTTTPTTEAPLKARADRLEKVLAWAREGLPGAVKVEDSLVLRAEVLVDDLEADKARRFDYVLHRYDAAFDSGSAADGEWITSKAGGAKCGVGVLVLAPARSALARETFSSDLGRGQGTLHGIRVHAKAPSAEGRFVTIASPLDAGDARPRSEISAEGAGLVVTVTAAGRTWRCRIPADPAKESVVSAK